MSRKRALVISLSDGLRDPRPRRVAKWLSEFGFEVTQVGLPPIDRQTDAWEYLAIPSENRTFSTHERLEIFSLSVKSAATHYLSRLSMGKFIEIIEDSGDDLLYVLDYVFLPFVAKKAETTKAKVLYEAREHYLTQNYSDGLWKFYMPRVVRYLEGTNIRKVHRVITVSNGIARILQRQYKLAKLPDVIFGFPNWDFSDSGLEVNDEPWRKFLFHGNLSYDREIHRLLLQFSFSRDGNNLTIRGSANQDYRDHLAQIIKSLELQHRVTCHDSVPYHLLQQVTSQSGIGIIPWRNHYIQKKFSMPNKLFEYLAAGLPILTSDKSEISELVKEHGIGWTFNADSLLSLSKVIDTISEKEYRLARNSTVDFVHFFGYSSQKRKFESIIEECMKQ